jgi:nanoRNase/pAp phosphatase (c-di-AMP/oligoRNAs hydrolase)
MHAAGVEEHDAFPIQNQRDRVIGARVSSRGDGQCGRAQRPDGGEVNLSGGHHHGAGATVAAGHQRQRHVQLH